MAARRNGKNRTKYGVVTANGRNHDEHRAKTNNYGLQIAVKRPEWVEGEYSDSRGNIDDVE